MSYVRAGQDLSPSDSDMQYTTTYCRARQAGLPPSSCRCSPQSWGQHAPTSSSPQGSSPQQLAHQTSQSFVCVQRMLDSGLMRGLSAVEIVPVNAIEEGVVLRDQSLNSAELRTIRPAATATATRFTSI